MSCRKFLLDALQRTNINFDVAKSIWALLFGLAFLLAVLLGQINSMLDATLLDRLGDDQASMEVPDVVDDSTGDIMPDDNAEAYGNDERHAEIAPPIQLDDDIFGAPLSEPIEDIAPTIPIEG